MVYSVLNSKQKQRHDCKSNKMRESTVLWIGNFEENIYLSCVHLAVLPQPFATFSLESLMQK